MPDFELIRVIYLGRLALGAGKPGAWAKPFRRAGLVCMGLVTLKWWPRTRLSHHTHIRPIPSPPPNYSPHCTAPSPTQAPSLSRPQLKPSPFQQLHIKGQDTLNRPPPCSICHAPISLSASLHLQGLLSVQSLIIPAPPPLASTRLRHTPPVSPLAPRIFIYPPYQR